MIRSVMRMTRWTAASMRGRKRMSPVIQTVRWALATLVLGTRRRRKVVVVVVVRRIITAAIADIAIAAQAVPIRRR